MQTTAGQVGCCRKVSGKGGPGREAEAMKRVTVEAQPEQGQSLPKKCVEL